MKSKSLAEARKRGYLDNVDESGFKYTFVGAWLSKYPNRVGILDSLKKIVGRIPQWEDLTDRTMKEFKDELESRMCANSVHSIFQRLKAVLNDNKMEVDIPSKRYDAILKKKGEPSQGTFLTESEISMFENVKTLSESEEYTKAIFLISCYTGCRHSDAVRMETENIQDGVLTYVSQKTKTKSTLPAHRNIYKYIGKFPSNVYQSDVTMNANIRALAQRAGINTKVKVFKAGVEITAPKYELISSHTARRSFCTNLRLRGVDLLTICRLAGHSSIEMTQRYIVADANLPDSAMSFFK